VRELDNLLQRALILVNGPVIGPEHIQFELMNEPLDIMPATTSHTVPVEPQQLQTDAPASLARSLDQTEKELILEALRIGNGRREVAERLGISPRTLRHKLARLREAGVDVPAA
jgi:two-component system response regulator FlrC